MPDADTLAILSAFGPTGLFLAFLLTMARLVGPAVRDYFIEGTRAFKALADIAPELRRELRDIAIDVRVTREDMAAVKEILRATERGQRSDRARARGE